MTIDQSRVKVGVLEHVDCVDWCPDRYIALGQIYIVLGQIYIALGQIYIALGQIYDLIAHKYEY